MKSLHTEPRTCQCLLRRNDVDVFWTLRTLRQYWNFFAKKPGFNLSNVCFSEMFCFIRLVADQNEGSEAGARTVSLEVPEWGPSMKASSRMQHWYAVTSVRNLTVHWPVFANNSMSLRRLPATVPQNFWATLCGTMPRETRSSYFSMKRLADSASSTFRSFVHNKLDA